MSKNADILEVVTAFMGAGLGALGFGFAGVLVFALLLEKLVFVIAVPGVISAAASELVPGSGVSSPVRSGDQSLVLLVLGALLVRLRWGVGLKLYSEILPLVNRF